MENERTDYSNQLKAIRCVKINKLNYFVMTYATKHRICNTEKKIAYICSNFMWQIYSSWIKYCALKLSADEALKIAIENVNIDNLYNEIWLCSTIFMN